MSAGEFGKAKNTLYELSASAALVEREEAKDGAGGKPSSVTHGIQ